MCGPAARIRDFSSAKAAAEVLERETALARDNLEKIVEPNLADDRVGILGFPGPLVGEGDTE
jgi:hypothetical protein